MAEPAPALDPSVRAGLEKLADIAVPPPPSLTPQTWGWAVLAAVVLALALWGWVRWRRRREAERYRREALAELAAIMQSMEDGAKPEALAAIPPLLKRVALATWPRARVARLTQSRWIDFLGRADGGAALPAPLTRFLDDIEYRRPEELAAMSAADARACAKDAGRWIETHHVSA